jgi:GTPase SAR1 family protein
MEELKAQADPDIAIVLVGNKADLVERSPGLRKVSIEQAQKLAQEHDMIFEETSALTSLNVTDAFERLLQGIYKEDICNNGGVRNCEEKGIWTTGSSKWCGVGEKRSD